MNKANQALPTRFFLAKHYTDVKQRIFLAEAQKKTFMYYRIRRLSNKGQIPITVDSGRSPKEKRPIYQLPRAKREA